MNDLKTGDATVSGQASVIRAADKAAGLRAGSARVEGVITVVRAGTGKVEHFNFVGEATHGDDPETTKE